MGTLAGTGRCGEREVDRKGEDRIRDRLVLIYLCYYVLLTVAGA